MSLPKINEKKEGKTNQGQGKDRSERRELQNTAIFGFVTDEPEKLLRGFTWCTFLGRGGI